MSVEAFKYDCKNCDYKTTYISQWNKHIETELHKTGKRKTRLDKKCIDKCPFCTYNSKGNTNMKQHILNDHGTTEERKTKFKYYCDCCDYGTFAKSLYEKHTQTQKHINFIKYTKN